MARNWGLSGKSAAMRAAANERPILSLLVTAVFGIGAAAISTLAFSDAAGSYGDLFHGASLAFAVAAAGFGCWLYVFVAWPRFAANFTGRDGFSTLLTFYARASAGLVITAIGSAALATVASPVIAGALACFVGGAAAAAAFQTVIAFVPGIDAPNG
ncbi:MAG: hypothetical protein GC152_08100 [Alphaproteobacteria bacterium]|nr:hypothetical protein [Alphaproteobacteria bacterium]